MLANNTSKMLGLARMPVAAVRVTAAVPESALCQCKYPSSQQTHLKGAELFPGSLPGKQLPQDDAELHSTNTHSGCLWTESR